MYLIKMAARFLSKTAEEQFVQVLPQVIKKATTYPGFIHVDFWRNYQDPDLLLEDSYWESKDAADAWRNDPFHKHLQRLAYSTLLMENTTTFWTQSGDVKMYTKCPVCGTADTKEMNLKESPLATHTSSTCKTCGFILPSTPPAA